MSGELADFRTTLPERYAYGVMGALRQTLKAAGLLHEERGRARGAAAAARA